MKYNYMSFEIGNQIFAISLDKIVKIIEKPITKILGNSNNQLPVMVAEINQIEYPMINLSLFLGTKNRTNPRNGYLILVERNQNNEKGIVGIQIDSMPEVIELDPNQIYHYPPISEAYPCFIAEALYIFNGREITLIDIDKMHDNERVRMKKLLEQFIMWQ